jgi:hypothetical protein
MALRCSVVRLFARALPPFKPPSLPSATAAGFFWWPFDFVASLASSRLINSSRPEKAISFSSFLLERLGIYSLCHNQQGIAVREKELATHYYPTTHNNETLLFRRK